MKISSVTLPRKWSIKLLVPLHSQKSCLQTANLNKINSFSGFRDSGSHYCYSNIINLRISPSPAGHQLSDFQRSTN